MSHSVNVATCTVCFCFVSFSCLFFFLFLFAQFAHTIAIRERAQSLLLYDYVSNICMKLRSRTELWVSLIFITINIIAPRLPLTKCSEIHVIFCIVTSCSSLKHSCSCSKLHVLRGISALVRHAAEFQRLYIVLIEAAHIKA